MLRIVLYITLIFIVALFARLVLFLIRGRTLKHGSKPRNRRPGW